MATLRDANVSESVNESGVETLTIPTRSSAPSRSRSIMLKIENDKLKLPTREDTRENLRRLVAESGLMEAPGTFEISQEAIGGIYAALGMLEAALASSITKVPFAKCAEVFAYSDSDIEALQGPTEAVLRKHCASLARWADEMNLAFVLVRIHTIKLIQLKFVRAQLGETSKPTTVAKPDGKETELGQTS